MSHHHFVVLSLPIQSHINPTLQLAKTLARYGARVTFATTVFGLSRMKTLPTHAGISYATFSDGYDDEAVRPDMEDFEKYLSDVKRVGSQTLTTLLNTLSNEGRPVTSIIYTVLLQWVAAVAREFHVPSAFLSIQCATAFSIYHHFFNSLDGRNSDVNPSDSIKISGLPLFSYNDLPTYLVPTGRFYSVIFPIFEETIRVLEQEEKPCVLVNSFDALETEPLKAIPNMDVMPIGPLIPSAFSDGNDSTDKSFGCDLIEKNSKDYLKWLDSKEERSVVYVSFGSLAQLKTEQKEEMFHGLVEFGKPFLFVIRSSSEKETEAEENALGGNGLDAENGCIVGWCSQVEVLAHKSIGCFVTHCGWNSTLESIFSGVPIVGCPQFSDQTMNGKLVEEVWCNGVRARGNDDGVVERKEIKRCLEMVMGGGEEGEMIRKNAAKWRTLGLEAVKEGGSSNKNLKMFLDNLG